MWRRILVVFALSILLTTVYSQTPTGQIRGRVLDQSQGVLSAAAITVVNTETGVALRSQSNSKGNFLVTNLIPGVYRLEVVKQGFNRFSRQPLQVRAGDVLNVDVLLEIASVAQQVEVRAETPLLESANATLGQVTEARSITDLPLPANSPFYISQLVPGAVTTTSPTSVWTPDALAPSGQLALGGAAVGANVVSVDGTPIMSINNEFTLNPPSEMIAEVQVTTAAYDASQGRFAGGEINMVMKTGGNDLHGSAMFQNLSRGLMARDTFTNRAIYDLSSGPVTPAKIDRLWPPQRQLRFEGTMSGPVIIPGLYNGKNRTFWVFGGDDLSRQKANPAYYTVPTAAERQGDFSALLNLGSQYQIYNPFSTTPLGNGRYGRSPFPGNIIPPSLFNPVALKALSYYPLPNIAGNPDGSQNYASPAMADTPYSAYLGRVDHYVNDRNRIFGSFNIAYDDPVSGDYFNNQSAGTVRTRTQHGLTLEYTYTPGPSTVITVRYGLNRFSDDTAPPSMGFNLASLGISPSLTSQLDSHFTTLSPFIVGGLSTVGSASATLPHTTYHYLSADAVRQDGNHTLHFGGEVRFLAYNYWNLGNVSPSYNFSGGYTNGPFNNSPVAPTGQGLASMLLGVPTGGSIALNSSSADMSRYWALFLQDDWKVTNKLTINAGLRWEYDSPDTERYNRVTRGFAFGATNPIEQAAVAQYALHPLPELPVADFSVTGGLLFAGVNGAPRSLLNPDRNNFSPRIGLAYKLSPKTVIRTGYGIFFVPTGSDFINSTRYQTGFSQATSLVPSLDSGLTFQATLANPFPNGLLQPVGSSAGLLTGIGQSLSVLDPNIHNGYTQRWSFNIQRLLPGNFLLDVGYMGTHSTGLLLSRQLDGVPAQYLSTTSVRNATVINYLSALVSNPFGALSQFAGTSLSTTTVAQQQLLRPYPEFTGITLATNGGSASYNALQVHLERRFAAGYTLQASYTFSKSMAALDFLNETDLAPSREISSIDQTHVLSMSGVYELPFGKAKPFLNSSRILDLVAGGWSIQGIWQASSGMPLTWGNILFTGDINNIALPGSQKTANEWFNINAGFDRNSADQLADNIRTFPLRLSGVRGPGVDILNASAFKNFTIWERVKLQLRAEAVDAANGTMLTAPNVSPTSGAFGQITSIAAGSSQRRITLGVKLDW